MNASAALHALALAICFTAHFAHADELDGVRRALQTMASVEGQTKFGNTIQPAPAR